MSHSPQPLWTKNFILITLINLFLFLGFQMFPAALPPYLKSLGAPDSLLGWVAGISTVATLLTRPVAGIFLDKIGRRGFFMLGLAIMLASTLAFYFFPVVWIILLIRFIHGLGWGLASTASNTIASDFIPKPRFGEGMGYFSLSSSLAMAISPAIALSLGAGPMILTATGFMAVATLMALSFRYRETPKAAPGRPRAFPYEKASAMPALVMFMVTITYGATITFLAVYAGSRGIGNIGGFFMVYALTMILTRPHIGKIIDRKGLDVVILPGLALICLTLVLLSQADSLPLFLGRAVLYGVGQGCVHTGTQTMAVLQAPRDRVGAANATFFTGFDGGIGVGAVAAGWVASFFGYSQMFLILAVFPVIAGITFRLIIKKRPLPAPASTDIPENTRNGSGN